MTTWQVQSSLIYFVCSEFSCAAASMQQSVYGAGGPRGSPIAGGGSAYMKKDGGETVGAIMGTFPMMKITKFQ
jgi:hypothetical protein